MQSHVSNIYNQLVKSTSMASYIYTDFVLVFPFKLAWWRMSSNFTRISLFLFLCAILLGAEKGFNKQIAIRNYWNGPKTHNRDSFSGIYDFLLLAVVSWEEYCQETEFANLSTNANFPIGNRREVLRNWNNSN